MRDVNPTKEYTANTISKWLLKKGMLSLYVNLYAIG